MGFFFEGVDPEYMRHMARRLDLSLPALGMGQGAPAGARSERAEVLQRIARRLKRECYYLLCRPLDGGLLSFLGELLPGSDTLAERVGHSLEVFGDLVAWGRGDLDALERRGRSAMTLWRLAARLRSGALDARLLVGAVGWSQVDRVVRSIEEEFSRFQGPRPRDAILADFAPALVLYDKVLRRINKRLREMKAQRESLAHAPREVQEAASVEWAILHFYLGEARPSRAALLAAARHFMQKRGAQPGPGLLRDGPLNPNPAGITS